MKKKKTENETCAFSVVFTVDFCQPVKRDAAFIKHTQALHTETKYQT